MSESGLGMEHKGAVSDSTACICNLANCKRAYESVDWLLMKSRMVAIDRDQCEPLRKLPCPSGVVDGSNDRPPKSENGSGCLKLHGD